MSESTISGSNNTYCSGILFKNGLLVKCSVILFKILEKKFKYNKIISNNILCINYFLEIIITTFLLSYIY